MKLLTLTSFLLFTAAATHLAAAPAAPPAAPATSSVLTNGGFESGTGDWSIFIPSESTSANCRFDVVSDTPHSGTNCVRMQSDDFGRFSVGCSPIPVQPGEHYRVSVWIKADAAATIRPSSPGITTTGFVVRLYLGQAGSDAAGGHLFIAPGNRVTRDNPADPVAPTLPTTWTKIEAVVEIPSGVDKMGPGLFSWWTKGAIFADDFAIEKVDASTPVTPFWTKTAGTP
jgi:hypothetical protein